MYHPYRILFVILVVWAWSVEPVAAYIDPGTGTALIQTLLAGIVALGLVVRRHVHTALRRLRGDRNDAANS